MFYCYFKFSNFRHTPIISSFSDLFYVTNHIGYFTCLFVSFMNWNTWIVPVGCKWIFVNWSANFWNTWSVILSLRLNKCYKDIIGIIGQRNRRDSSRTTIKEFTNALRVFLFRNTLHHYAHLLIIIHSCVSLFFRRSSWIYLTVQELIYVKLCKPWKP